MSDNLLQFYSVYIDAERYVNMFPRGPQGQDVLGLIDFI